MTLFGDAELPRERREVAPGAVHVPGWLDLEQQRWLVARSREWAAGPVPPRAARLPTGGVMSVRSLGLGWHWRPYTYSRDAPDVNGARVLAVPDWLVRLGRRAVAEAYGDDSDYAPDVALVNYYDDGARMGMHQDKDEVSRAPVVSMSVGDTAVFRFGTAESRARPYTDVELLSGDLFVFGGGSRLAYHGVPKVYAGTAPAGCGLDGGRLNVTLRVTGFA